jgi:hypothetical protein
MIQNSDDRESPFDESQWMDFEDFKKLLKSSAGQRLNIGYTKSNKIRKRGSGGFGKKSS